MASTPEHRIADYRFRNGALLEEALSHPSLDKGVSYQRLEFLGDRVLGLVIANALYATFPDEAEGILNNRLSALVRRETVAEVALKLGLDRQIQLSEGADSDGTRTKPSVLCDVGEAVIGAIYLDGGIDAAQAFVLKQWADFLSGKSVASKDAKTALQEWAQARGMPLPTYQVLERKGPDHAPMFRIAAIVEDGRRAEAEARSKRAGEQAAAATLLKQLEV